MIDSDRTVRRLEIEGEIAVSKMNKAERRDFWDDFRIHEWKEHKCPCPEGQGLPWAQKDAQVTTLHVHAAHSNAPRDWALFLISSGSALERRAQEYNWLL